MTVCSQFLGEISRLGVNVREVVHVFFGLIQL